jgi:hypothetical protein
MSAAAETTEAGAALPAASTDRDAAHPVELGRVLTGVLVFLFVSMAVIGSYNAWNYPAELSYDWLSNYTYAEGLIHHGHIPTQAEGGSFYTPPGFYAIGGAALWVGEQLGMAHPAELLQQLNVVFVLATAYLLLLTARMLFPRRPLVWAASLGFFAFLPVVTKTEAMFHPEPLNMLVAAAATTLATWMIVNHRFGKRELAGIAFLLAFGQLIRASQLFTLAAVGISLVVAALARRGDRRRTLRRIAIGVAALCVLIAPWYVHQARKLHTALPIAPNFTRTLFHPGNGVLVKQGGVPHYLSLPLVEMYRWPTRPHYINAAFPTTYVETWDDWLGWWAWVPDKQPSGHTLRVMRDQILIGALPTLLALAGGAWLLVSALRRRRELLPVALLPLIALASYLYRSYSVATIDGDLLKASYLLVTAPMWALAFGVAFERIARLRWALLGLTALFAAFAVLELRFLVYGMRAGRALF